MKALILEEFNRPYRLTNVERPIAGKGQAVVKIHSSGVNPLDIKICAGQAAHAKPHLPGIFGIDFSGTVEAVGEDVTAVKPGDKVFGMAGGIAGIPGSLAEFAAVDVNLLAIQPENISMKEAAALPLVFITAWEALVDRATIRRGDKVLIHGGAGGVGHVAIQIAVSQGAQVYATCGASDRDRVHGLGATAIDYAQVPFEEYVSAYTDSEGFDVVLDTLGGAVLDNSFKSVKQYTGHVISILGWGTHSLAPLSFRGASYSGVFTLYPLITGKYREHQGEILREAAKLIGAGKLHAWVDQAEYRLETVAEAYEAVRGRRGEGKVVIGVV